MQALTPLTIGRSNVRATMLGALWGFGHSIGQLILGLLMVLLKVRCHPLRRVVHWHCGLDSQYMQVSCTGFCCSKSLLHFAKHRFQSATAECC